MTAHLLWLIRTRAHDRAVRLGLPWPNAKFTLNYSMKRAWLIPLACALPTIVGCATRKPPNGENYYVQATQEYSQHFYQASVDDYQKLIDEYPFSPYAEEAELNIGLAYYKMHNYPEAIGSFQDFLRMHPTSKHLDVASYYLAMSHYDQMGRPDQDQTHTQAALAEFQDIVRRFPESDFASLSREQIDICREMLARHDYLIGQFYVQRANYRAAESRMAELMALYPDTPIAPQGLYELGMTLEKQGKKIFGGAGLYRAQDAFSRHRICASREPRAEEAQSANRYRGRSAQAGFGGEWLRRGYGSESSRGA